MKTTEMTKGLQAKIEAMKVAYQSRSTKRLIKSAEAFLRYVDQRDYLNRGFMPGGDETWKYINLAEKITGSAEMGYFN